MVRQKEWKIIFKTTSNCEVGVCMVILYLMANPYQYTGRIFKKSQINLRRMFSGDPLCGHLYHAHTKKKEQSDSFQWNTNTICFLFEQINVDVSSKLKLCEEKYVSSSFLLIFLISFFLLLVVFAV